MFDIGFSELLVIGVVALLVLGPERLPRAAKITGLWVRRAKASWYSVKAELERELADEELKRSLKSATSELHQARDDLREGLQPPTAPKPAEPPAAADDGTAKSKDEPPAA